MLIIIISFFSGILSVLAPCVLPVIPVIFGWGLAAQDNKKSIRIILSMLFFIFIFTFLLKVSTAFIGISTQTRATISGAIIVLYSCTLLFPTARERIQVLLPQVKTPSWWSGKRWDILLGASLWPIFATCSPTYALLLSTILPVSIPLWIMGILAYLVWFWGFLYVLITWGRSLIKKFYGLADTQGRFKKILGILLLVTWVMIMSGWMKQLEAKLVTFVPDIGRVESQLQSALDLSAFKEEKNTKKITPTNSWTSQKNMQQWWYQEYDPENIPQTGDIILFFHADRCPTCNEAEKNLLASGVPEGVTILKVDYDTATDLKRKYAILTQTSYVLIKPDGTMIKRRVWWRNIDEIMAKVTEAKSESPAKEPKKPSWVSAISYLAGGCFRCMEWPFEALEWVKEVINGYAWWSAETADYKTVSTGKTKHREAVKIVYDPGIVSYEELLATYRTQIDPTDAGGQFADRGFQYTPAIYYQTSDELERATTSKQTLEQAKTFSDPVAVQILPFESFYAAEEYHQDYYKKQSLQYKLYKKWSGRSGFIDDNEDSVKEVFEKWQTPPTTPDLSHLTEQQKDILFNWWTEPPFNNAYRDNHEAGIYVDVIDGTPLFSSTDKFDSGTGRPSFTRPIDESLLSTHTDNKLWTERTEIKSATSNSHLWHVFDDWPQDAWGKRYCINSAALNFVPLADMNTERYEKYLVLFE